MTWLVWARALQQTKQGCSGRSEALCFFHGTYEKLSEELGSGSYVNAGGDDPGRYVREVAPNPQAITLREHHSMIELPDGDFTAPRV